MLYNGKPYFDENGEVLHAHGGWILPYDGMYYWYGEDRRENFYVSCYRSRDLHTWTRCEPILTTDTPCAHTDGHFDLRLRTDDGGKVNIERPKMLYNPKTKRFVLWAHWENGRDYHDARCCVASSEFPDHGFVYHGSMNPYGHMSRDCTVFTDLSGDTYFISAARDNADLHIYRLTEDFLNVDEHVRTLFQHEFREAPALFMHDGKYYMLSSYCTGWAPNQAKWSVSDSVTGRWSPLRNIADETTYRSQSAFVLTVDGVSYYVGDRWGGGGDAYFTSTYVVLPIRFDENGCPTMDWADTCPLF